MLSGSRGLILLIFLPLLSTGTAHSDDGGCLKVLEPKDGVSLLWGKTRIRWLMSPRQLEDSEGMEVAVSLDGSILATMPVAVGEQELHLHGASEGSHQLLFSCYNHSQLLSTSAIPSLVPKCQVAVRFSSVGPDGCENLPQLARLRRLPMLDDPKRLDSVILQEENSLEGIRDIILGRCGSRSLQPEPTPKGCLPSCTGQECCCQLCCRLANKCVRLSDEDGDKLQELYERLEDRHRSFHTRKFAFQAMESDEPETSVTIIWHGRQYSGMEADYIESLFKGLIRSAVNDTSLQVFAPNAILVLQESFPVHGKEEFWQPVRAYLDGFATRGFTVSVFLTSDELYFAPTDWVPKTLLTIRNCWHPGLHSEENVISVPFGFKSGFNLPSQSVHGTANCASSLERRYRWNFIGNANSSKSRMLLIDEIAANGGAENLKGKLHLTHTFDDPIHGLRIGGYKAILQDSLFTFAPEGVHVESYRLSEALEVASIPVVSCDDYFQGIFGDGHPVPCVQTWSWAELEALMSAIESEQSYSCVLASWWKSYKAGLRNRFRRAFTSDRQGL